MSMLQPIRKTVAEYLAYDEERVELIDGEFLVTPAPTRDHQNIVANLLCLLRPQARRLKLGEVHISPFDAILDPYNVVQPDLLFLRTESLKRLRPRLEGPPDVAIEVLSKGGRRRDLVKKKKLYLEFGVPEYWIVDAESTTVTVLVRSDSGWCEHGVFGKGGLVTSMIMTGVVAAVAEVFE